MYCNKMRTKLLITLILLIGCLLTVWLTLSVVQKNISNYESKGYILNAQNVPCTAGTYERLDGSVYTPLFPPTPPKTPSKTLSSFISMASHQGFYFFKTPNFSEFLINQYQNGLSEKTISKSTNISEFLMILGENDFLENTSHQEVLVAKSKNTTLTNIEDFYGSQKLNSSFALGETSVKGVSFFQTEDTAFNTKDKIIVLILSILLAIISLFLIATLTYTFLKRRMSRKNILKLNSLQEVCNNVPTGLFKVIVPNAEERDDLQNFVIDFINEHSMQTFGFDFDKDTPKNVRSLAKQIDPSIVDDAIADIKRQLMSQKKFRSRLPILNAKGENKWISISGNLFRNEDKQYLICSHTDVTKEVSLQHNLYSSKAKFETILSHAGIAVISYDFQTKDVYTSPACQQRFGDLYNLYINKNLTEAVPQDDLAELGRCCQFLSQENPTATSQIRIFSFETEQHIWCRVEATLFFMHGLAKAIIFRFSDIDKFVQQNIELRQIAERDSMTSVYNKKTTERLIQSYLSSDGEEGTHALLVADIDDFKNYNDTYGHNVGDKIIIGLAHSFCKHFRSTDIVGRIGGDEFLVFMKNVPNLDFVRQKCNELRLEYILNGENKLVTLSIGIALFPSKGKTFNELFEAADAALYRVKKKGKNNCGD